jgi:polysaccharide export outer membrane protein
VTLFAVSPSRRRACGALTAAALLAGPLIALGGCADLPSSGPTASAVVAAAHDPHAALPFDIVEVTPDVVADRDRPTSPQTLAALPSTGAVDAIGPGDGLQISIFEVGAALFSGRSGAAAATAGEAPSAAGEALPIITVGRDGQVDVPYIGPIQAAGLTPDALAAQIQAGLAGKSQAPQVVVTIHDNIANTAVVMGDVKKPGRIALTLARERVLDAIADAGGATNATADNTVTLTRGAASATMPLVAMTAASPDDVELRPQDRLEVDYRPRTYTVFGAAGKVQEMPFQNPRVSLAEALARVGGPNDQLADASAVFVFRYEPAGFDGAPLPGARPVAYRLNLLEAQSYLLAQRFEMKSRDVIYVANAASNQPTKLLQVLNLFFQPFYTAKVVSQ